MELKEHDTPAPVVQTLRAAAFVEQVLTGSFDLWLSQRAKLLEPRIRTSVLSPREDRHADYVEWALAVGADCVHPCWEHASPTPHKLLSPALIAGIRQRGLGIILWHEERPAGLRGLVRLDVDGICTDMPDLLSRILAEKQESTIT